MDAKANELRRILSTNIKKHRKILGITQENLAEAANLSWQTINSIEGCRLWLSDKTMIKIARILHVEPYQLLLPHSEGDAVCKEAGNNASPQETLIVFKENICKSIELQFEKAMKSILQA